MRLVLTVCACVTLTLGVLSFAASSAARTTADTQGRVPVLVELFTSEGCSSCPPADDLLSALLADQPVAGAEAIVLSEHVDYWNRLGWTDPYSSPSFSERQRAFARTFGLDSVYTPQAVINGTTQVIGSNRRLVSSAIARAAAWPSTRVTVQVGDVKGLDASVRVSLDRVIDRPRGRPRITLVVAEDHLVSNVARGENARRTLRHVGVVRSVLDVGVLTAGVAQHHDVMLRLQPTWAREALRLVAFIEEPGTMKVLGVGQTRLTSDPKPRS